MSPGSRSLSKGRTVLAVGLAGLATAGLGTAVLPAGAQLRSFEITLTDGTVVERTLEVDPAVPL